MRAIIRELRWRYRMWRMQTFIAYGVENGVVKMSVSKTGFFRPLHQCKDIEIDTKKWETCGNTLSTKD